VKIRIPEGMNLPRNWRYAKRYPLVIDEHVKLVPYALAVKAVRFTGYCVVDHGERLVKAGPSSWLCGPCTDDLVKALRGIERSWPALQDMLYPVKGVGEVGSKSVDPAVPLDLTYVDGIAKIETAVRGVATQLLEDRPDLAPTRNQDVGAIAGELARWHLSWITGHPNSSLAAQVLEDIWAAWVEIPRDASNAKDYAVHGRCTVTTAVVAGRKVTCPGELRASIRDNGSKLYCTVNPEHVVPRSQWLLLMNRGD
jgi:hypothetical protein